MVVVLPAPFGPRKPKISPAPTEKPMPRTASTSPYFLARSSTSIGRGSSYAYGAASPAQADRGAAAARRGRHGRCSARARTSRTMSWRGDSAQAGSVAPASPASANAWQRQPPKSTCRSSQVRHGAGIQSSPRNARSAGESLQMSASGRSRTFSNASPVMLPAWWHGNTTPSGVTTM